MATLCNVDTRRGGQNSSCVRAKSCTLPEKEKLQVGVTPNCVHEKTKAWSYNSENKTITTSSTDANVITRELIHAAQDAMGILDGNSRSAEEFQEKALGDIADYADMLKNGGHGFGATLDIDSEDKANEWRDFVINCFDDRDTFDRENLRRTL